MPILHRYQAVIFDLDDTLVSSGRIKWAQHKAVAREYYDYELTDETLNQYWGMPFDTMIGLLHNHADTVANMHKAYEATEHRFLKELQPETLPTLDILLNAGLKIGLLSAMNRPDVVWNMERLGFPMEQFEFIQGAGDTPVHKPDPEVFAPALAHLAAIGIIPAKTVYVGDALIDFEAAKHAGLGFIAVTTGFTPAAEFERAGAHHILNLASLPELILGSTTP
ncbi:MAG TPA: HAD-IA family hydrolase [Candidatus Saccharimonadia bacterium]|jgi:HAD superfamily hydrolase (TIGR01549 family)|nr:HAD-IA family hydrolase [Candidatus Saccharimonadia bacterium]